ncbi:hypothetical protein FT663_02371 [Candidozyma haemuli var. vulneris]|uniref:Uncharacterized protein n=1 Tax=Candidozyma haemuli TaxID=45357 RepID=A0A2V1AZ78_9ASCO|nr:hypothetical protein CXQ85_002884 [[Candida] haemuloni]KAF3988337.1 hypothetical protein FT662_03452 [[Candida] haemuloni var. vulneris]KAF3992181.1 hypothetical protein FT663_02371 [[Candida] haemuloni var. vulneris]PVH23155.1 hypothetical protein CXQ85_002884 [[Candida] haemuloni]
MDPPPYSESYQPKPVNKAGPILPPYQQDQIPGYSSSLGFSGVALLKKEFDTPWSSSSASLKAVCLELNSNQLNIYDFKDKALAGMVEVLFQYQNHDDKPAKAATAPAAALDNYLFDGDAYGEESFDNGPTVFGKLKKKYSSHKAEKKLAQLSEFSQFGKNGVLLEPTDDSQAAAKFSKKHRGKILHSFTLSNLQLGEAPSTNSVNYKEDLTSPTSSAALLKYRNTLRLRIEYSQILLHFWSFYGMVHWYRNLCIGRDLSSSLDTRILSRLKSIPRDYSPTNITLLGAAAREAFRPLSMESKRNSQLTYASSLQSTDSDGDSLMSRCSNDTTCTSLEGYERSFVEVSGSKITCFEEMYTPVEKQYISNCIPVLNSYDKWAGSKMTVSNYEKMLPKNDSKNVNEKGRVYISPMSFCSSVKSYQKQFPNLSITKKECKEYYVDDNGLVSIDCDMK